MNGERGGYIPPFVVCRSGGPPAALQRNGGADL